MLGFKLRVLTSGESHGSGMTIIIDGFPAGFYLNMDELKSDLMARKMGYGVSRRMKFENDVVCIVSGLMNGLTTGAPITIFIENEKSSYNMFFRKWHIPRSGHVDLVGAAKYGYESFNIASERASARETVLRVCLGSLCKQFLSFFNINIFSYVREIGNIKSNLSDSVHEFEYMCREKRSRQNKFYFVDSTKVSKLNVFMKKLLERGETVSGAIEVVATNVSVGLGSYNQWDSRIDAQLAMFMFSIPAVKGVILGSKFEGENVLGSFVNDLFFIDVVGNINRRKNFYGGVEGGVTNGSPIVVKVYFKPISSTYAFRKSIHFIDGVEVNQLYERGDSFILRRSLVIGESMLAYVLVNALLVKLGGDYMDEMLNRYFILYELNYKDLKVK